MTRNEVLNIVRTIPNNNVLLTLPTGFGKSYMAIERIKSLAKNGDTLLIVVPRNVLKVTWKGEFNKWWKDAPIKIEYTTYVSLHKHIGSWAFVIYDECHHLSERCRNIIKDFKTKYSILLSATVSRDLKVEFKNIFNNLYHLNASLRSAIIDKVLPDPTVYLLPLTLDNTRPIETIIKNPKAKGLIIRCSYKDKWNYIRQKNNPVHISCTQQQCLEDLNSQIEYYKKRRGNIICKNIWLRLCGDRLKYLSNWKTPVVSNILKLCKNHRTLTFCNSIEQTEVLGKYCINSKNKNSSDNLILFNTGKIKHITACNMLNEGINLINCKIGIYANLNSSETIVKQRMGRLLRHTEPIIIIPYYKNTREEELVKKMLEDYNPTLIHNINFIEEIKL